MFSTVALLAIFVWLSLLARARWRHGRGDRCLPSPPGLPLLGNLLDLVRRDLPIHFLELARHHGPIFRLRFGAHDIVVLNSIELIREALMKKWSDFAGRPRSYTGDLISFGGKDLSLGDYTAAWKIQRRLAHSSLQRCQRTNLEALIVQGAQDLCQEFQRYGGTPVDLADDFSRHTCKIIASLAFGTTFETHDPKFQEIHRCITDLVHLWGSPSIFALDFFPLYRKFPPAALDKLLKVVERRDAFVKEQLEEHKKTFQAHEIRDITDNMILFLKERGVETLNSMGDFDEQHVHMAIADLFIGGTETTASTLTWTVAFLIHHRQVQDTIYSELCDALSGGRQPTYSDREHLPFLNATIYEILRLRPVAPLAVPHRTTRDTREIPGGRRSARRAAQHLGLQHRSPGVPRRGPCPHGDLPVPCPPAAGVRLPTTVRHGAS
ncbi:steroid 21-hydroxylase isoform X2 [Ambystoma mexicanum]|uniref:steroid 21-hydroxylase isoform X2 n=1 Tax=Ambystoma mexicanum TaxID=8296 RepID=UPI0037E8BABC